MSKKIDMPVNVRRYLWLVCLSFMISFALTPWTPEDPGYQKAMSPQIYIVMMLIVEIFVVLIQVPLIWLAAWRRQNWARWTLLFLFICSLLLAVSMPAYFSSNLIFAIGAAVCFGSEAVAWYFFLSPEANAWFSGNKR